MNESPIFERVPSRTKQILTQTGGVPGYSYAMVLTENAGEAWRRGWQRVQGQPVYTFMGPKGQADFELWCFGEPIQGATSASGARQLLADPDIASRTGLVIPGTEEAEATTDSKPVPPVPSTPSKSGKPRGVAASP